MCLSDVFSNLVPQLLLTVLQFNSVFHLMDSDVTILLVAVQLLRRYSESLNVALPVYYHAFSSSVFLSPNS